MRRTLYGLRRRLCRLLGLLLLRNSEGLTGDETEGVRVKLAHGYSVYRTTVRMSEGKLRRETDTERGIGRLG